MRSWPSQSPEHSPADRIQYVRFSEEDQRLFISRERDYLNPELELNRLKNEIEALDETTLSEQEVCDRDNALWLWYHHGFQIAYAKHHDRQTAIAFINKTLEYGVEEEIDNPEREAGLELVTYFERLGEA